jgi:hypothetical protein
MPLGVPATSRRRGSTAPVVAAARTARSCSPNVAKGWNALRSWPTTIARRAASTLVPARHMASMVSCATLCSRPRRCSCAARCRSAAMAGSMAGCAARRAVPGGVMRVRIGEREGGLGGSGASPLYRRSPTNENAQPPYPGPCDPDLGRRDHGGNRRRTRLRIRSSPAQLKRQVRSSAAFRVDGLIW